MNSTSLSSRSFTIAARITGAFDRRSRGYAQVDAELARDDMRQRGLAEAGRRGEQDVVERLAASASRLDRHGENFSEALLTDELSQGVRS